MFELEKGTTCYVGDPDCSVPASLADIVLDGQQIHINKYGNASAIPNVFYGIWYSIVTMLTVGYGEIVAITNGGMLMATFLMLGGGLYMAMPLTVCATTYYLIHDLYHEKKMQQKAEEEQVSSSYILNVFICYYLCVCIQ